MDPRASHDTDPRTSNDKSEGVNTAALDNGDGLDLGHGAAGAGAGADQDPADVLPDDLPKSLDDRRSVPVFPQETEIYDAWQGRPFSSLVLFLLSWTCDR